MAAALAVALNVRVFPPSVLLGWAVFQAIVVTTLCRFEPGPPIRSAWEWAARANGVLFSLLPLLAAGLQVGGRLGTVRMEGEASIPAVRAGEWLLYERLRAGAELQLGDLVLVRCEVAAGGVQMARMVGLPGEKTLLAAGRVCTEAGCRPQERFAVVPEAEQAGLAAVEVAGDRFYIVYLDPDAPRVKSFLPAAGWMAGGDSSAGEAAVQPGPAYGTLAPDLRFGEHWAQCVGGEGETLATVFGRPRYILFSPALGRIGLELN
jgi:hypothetical protein